MFRGLLIGSLIWVVVCGCPGARFLDPTPPPVPTDVLFPMPENVTYGQQTVEIDRSFQFLGGSSSPILTEAVKRYEKLIRTSAGCADIYPSFYAAAYNQKQQNEEGSSSIEFESPLANEKADVLPLFYAQADEDKDEKSDEVFPVLSDLTISVRSSDDTLQLETDESYLLQVAAPHAKITANTIYGALRGLETFSQLICGVKNSTLVFSTPWVITDDPRFAHRGLLIDSSRHYLPIPSVKRTIDALSYNRMNVLHWHIVDAQSFPVLTKSVPELARAAYSPEEIYDTNMLSDVIEYAKSRGVRVVTEIDMPGHTASWGVAFPNITVCRDKTRQQGFCAENPCGELDPSNPFTFKIVSDLLNELMALFPDNYFHLGADEVVLACWNTPTINAWMKLQNLTSYQAVLNYFEQKIYQVAVSNKKIPIVWQEAYLEKVKLPANAVVQVWLDFETLDEVVKSGYKAILSNYQAWYLDCGIGNWCSYCSWLDMWKNDPLAGTTLTPAQQKSVLGGEVCMWGELVNDNNLDGLVWPRASAVAERLWSPAAKTSNVANAFLRLMHHSCRLSARGIQVAPLAPGSSANYCTHIQQ